MKTLLILLLTLIINLITISESFAKASLTKYQSQPNLKGYLCKPDGKGPFPAVIYNHGGLGKAIGGDPKGICEVLAREGFVGFSPLRRQTTPLKGHPQDVMSALEFIKNKDFVDSNKIGMMGFSRGALLTYMVSTRISDLKATVIMAPAPAKNTLNQFLSKASQVSNSTLILVSENDTAEFSQEGEDHVRLSKMLYEALKKEKKDVNFIIYPAFQNNGHELFYKVRDYFLDVTEFFNTKLR